jgi:hypothetical protein
MGVLAASSEEYAREGLTMMAVEFVIGWRSGRGSCGGSTGVVDCSSL